MATIVVAMFPEEGHLIPSLKIARTLKAKGHQVYYLALLDFEDSLRKEGFHFLPLLPDVFPKGWRYQQMQRLAQGNSINSIQDASQSAFYRALCQIALQPNNPVQHAILGIKADLCIIDSFLVPLALMFHALNIQVVTLSANINLPPHPDYPPVLTTIIPENTPASAAQARLAWQVSAFMLKLTSLVVRLDFRDELTKIAAHYGFPADMIVRTAMFPRLKPQSDIPELVLCPQAFDFPRTPLEPGIHYCEPSIDLERAGEDFPWEWIDPAKPLIFCTLGSQSHIYKQSRRFFQTVIDTFRQRPEWQLVMVIGKSYQTDAFQHVPTNAMLVHWAPHAQILKRSALMINHGGIGTIKECIFFNVPMLAFPITRDTPGCAARIAYHGLGLMGKMRGLTEEQLDTMLTTVIQNSTYSQNVTAMGDIFRAMEAASPAMTLIEERLANMKSSRSHLSSYQQD